MLIVDWLNSTKRYGEYQYPEYALNRYMMIVVMLNFIMLIVVMLNIIMQSVVLNRYDECCAESL